MRAMQTFITPHLQWKNQKWHLQRGNNVHGGILSPPCFPQALGSLHGHELCPAGDYWLSVAFIVTEMFGVYNERDTNLSSDFSKHFFLFVYSSFIHLSLSYLQKFVSEI